MDWLRNISIALRIIFFVLPVAVISIFRAVIRARSRGLDTRVAVRNGILRSVLTYLQPRELQYLLPAGRIVFQQWAATKKIRGREIGKTHVDSLEDGEAALFWVGDRDLSSVVVLFFHGGGYVLPLSRGHIAWAECFCEAGKRAGKPICVALLEYSLTPENIYPKQMRQATFALDHILSLGYTPSQVIIGGDSAGGHLSLSLLSHLLHQYSDRSFPSIRLSGPLRGCFLISPLLSLDLNTDSYVENRHSDLLSIPIIRDWGEDLFRDSPLCQELQDGQSWGMPLSGKKEWWDNLGAVVSKVYLTGGGEELFRDHIIQFGEVLKGLRNLDTQVHVEVTEAHDRAYMDFQTGAALSESTIGLINWVVDNITEET